MLFIDIKKAPNWAKIAYMSNGWGAAKITHTVSICVWQGKSLQI